ncbi:sulfate transporter CysZ [Thiocapsa roseopersicina]|uniref:Sulfate transporter CysZ n=1 Tax=Thiocapsa roseopersicina TaxID=1058 RepID=A0A1H2ZTH9_THIRO|nr:sulfate transporter CysZ [Thiocapsa roseopersicina]SDX20723.1 CysZ protein [Thiocapsa roseopersicina]
MATNPLSGAEYLLEGIRLIARPGLRRFVVIPLAVNILIFSAAIALGVRLFEHFLATLDARLPSWLGWLDWILWPMFVLVLLVVVFNLFALVANLIASPFNSLLAEKVERMLTGRPLDQGSSFASVIAESLPTLIDEIKKLLYAVVLAIPFLLLLFVPVVGQILWFLYIAWVLAVQYSDYPMGNHGMKFREMRRRLGRQRGMSLGFGASAAMLSMVPVVNFILMPSAVAGATAMWVRELKGANHYQGATQSRVATRWVLLVIDHLSGRIGGEVLAGPHAGRSLDQVPTEDLVEMLETCYASDPESAEALEVYLDRERGRKTAESPRRRHAEIPHSPIEQMQPEEARAILGIGPDAGPQEVRGAHRRLIQRLHPDRGGSDYLAAKINEAKQVLLG